MDSDINIILDKLSRSKFRSSFYLKNKDISYIKDKGLEKIRDHAYDFIHKRIGPSNIINDGKQTPYRGHPVFVAEHATATCCRGCLYKWYHIPKDRALTLEEEEFIVNVIMCWINRQYSSYK